MPTPFLVNDANAADGTSFTAVPSTTGPNLTQHPTSSGSDVLVKDNRYYHGGGSTTVGFGNSLPSSADQYVEGKIRVVSENGAYAGICLRMHATQKTYFSLHHQGNYWILSEWTNGTEDWFGGHSSGPLVAGHDYVFRIEANGDTVSYSVTDNGVPDGGVSGPHTGRALVANGYFGFFMNDSDITNGHHLDYLDGGILGSAPPAVGGAPNGALLLGVE